MPWNPTLYLKFESERFAPFEDLIRMVQIRPDIDVVDLGCGTGELTERLANALPGSRVLGIDSSAEMLERAQSRECSGLTFELRAIESMHDSWDLVFSHAAIHWIEDHHILIPKLFSLVRPGGQMVIQIPSNFGHASHILIGETAREPLFRDALSGWLRHPPVLSIDAYAELLYAHGAKDIVVYEKVYGHVLEDAADLADWVSGTALLPYLDRLPEDLGKQFQERYREHVRARWPKGPIYYPFRRILFSASR